MPKDRLMVEEPDGEVYEGHLEYAVARTQSRLEVSREEAERMIRAASIDNPLDVDNVKYWIEVR